MGKEILLVVEAVANEKDVGRDVIFGALESALAQATRKGLHGMADIRVAIDRRTGDYQTFQFWTVVPDDELENPDAEYTLEQAQEKKADAKIGDVIEKEIESVGFGRIEAQVARQVVAQKVREAERAKMVARYRDKLNELVNGTVKRVTRDFILIDLGEGAEGLLLREEQIQREMYRVNDRVRTLLKEIREDQRGAQLILSRAAPEVLTELFRIEVPEIAEEIIQIKGVARDPGMRAKIAVHTNDGRVDPVGACVGMRGSRVQAVSNELSGERVDIILWDDNPAQYVINAMSPAEVVSIIVDEDTNTMDLAVAEDQLSQAIGKGGQNIRLASELTGWTLNVMAESEAQTKQQLETDAIVRLFSDTLEVEQDLAQLLVDEGFSNIEEIAYVPIQELEALPGLDEEIIEALRERAKNALLTQAFTGKSLQKPAADLLMMDAMTPELADLLATNGIVTKEDLAEQAVDDLLDIEGIDEAQAAQLIMSARADWFANEEDA